MANPITALFKSKNVEEEDSVVLQHHNNHNETIKRITDGKWTANSIANLVMRMLNLISDVPTLYNISRVLHARIHKLKIEHEDANRG